MTSYNRNFELGDKAEKFVNTVRLSLQTYRDANQIDSFDVNCESGTVYVSVEGPEEYVIRIQESIERHAEVSSQPGPRYGIDPVGVFY